MNDDERIARLTELARREYGPRAAVYRRTWKDGEEAWIERSWDEAPCLSVEHPRALDALEAALLVLSSKYPGMMRLALADLSDRGKLSTAKVTLRSDEPPAWVEQLAAEWERASERPVASEPNLYDGTRMQTLEQCAAELRERAKGGERG